MTCESRSLNKFSYLKKGPTAVVSEFSTQLESFMVSDLQAEMLCIVIPRGTCLTYTICFRHNVQTEAAFFFFPGFKNTTPFGKHFVRRRPQNVHSVFFSFIRITHLFFYLISTLNKQVYILYFYNPKRVE